MTTADQQVAIFYNQQRDIAGANEVFMDLVREGLTREELEHNIKRRPSLRFASPLSASRTGCG